MFRQTVLVYHCGELTVAREFDGTSRILADSSEHVSLAFKFPNTPFVFMFFQRFSTNGQAADEDGSFLRLSARNVANVGKGNKGKGKRKKSSKVEATQDETLAMMFARNAMVYVNDDEAPNEP